MCAVVTVRLMQVLGGVQKSGTGDVTGAKVIALTYTLAGNKTFIDDQADDLPMLGWEEVLLEKLKVSDRSSFRTFKCEHSMVQCGGFVALHFE